MTGWNDPAVIIGVSAVVVALLGLAFTIYKSRTANLVPRPKKLDPFNYAIEIQNYGKAPARNVKILIDGKLLGNTSDIAPNDSIIHKMSYLQGATIDVDLSWNDGAGSHRYKKNMCMV